MSVVPAVEVLDDFASFGIRAFTTSRDAGSFGLMTDEPVRAVMERWAGLRANLSSQRLATAHQVHGSRVIVHEPGWEGWLRVDGADGHVATHRGTAMTVTVADCVPVFVAHPSGASALLHSGWRGTEARIVQRGIEALAQRGFGAAELHVHLGPAICGTCYEVSAEVFTRLTGRPATAATCVDLRALIADHARALGVKHITVSSLCTRCDNERLFSHRCGDAGRQLGVLVAEE